MKNPVSKLGKFEIPVILFAFWVVVILLVNPIGDFPLNDDFSFGRTVFNLTEEGTWKFDDWLSMTLFTQVLWGGAFTCLFGFSFTVLRFSTLIISFVGILAMFQLCQEAGLDKKNSLLATTLLAFNPLYFSLSFTFMTDVPFLSLCIISALFYLKYCSTNKVKWLAWGTLAAIAATLIRQLGIMLPMAFAISMLLTGRKELRTYIVAFFPVVVAVATLLLYQEWFAALQPVPETFGQVSKLFKRLSNPDFISDCFDRIGLLLIYFGLFLAPLTICWYKFQKPKNAINYLLCLFGIIAMLGIWDRFPWGNILYNLGLGPKTLKDGAYFINVTPMLPLWFWKTIALVGIASFSYFILSLKIKGVYFKFSVSTPLAPQSPVGEANPLRNFEIHPIKAIKSNPVHAFSMSIVILYGGFLMLDVHFFDRYFLPLLPFIILLFWPKNKSAPSNRLKTVGISILIITSIFSIACTHDYLLWNRARWKALDYLTEEKSISPNEINGGFEFNGWHRPVKERTYGEFKSWWWVDQENYLISFGKMDGFSPVKVFQFNTYLPPWKGDIYVLKKD